MKISRSLQRVVCALTMLVALMVSGPALAGTPTLTFDNGWVGEYSSNANQPVRMYAFDGGSTDLNIKSVTISQNSSTNQFEIPGSQGNDVPVSVTVNFVNGTRQTVQGKVNWKIGTNQNPDAVGVIFDQAPTDGYSLTSGRYKTYLLKVKTSTFRVSDGGAPSGNASGVLSFLNSILEVQPSFTVSKSAPASVVEGASLAYTIGIGNAGGASSGTSVTIQDALPSGVTFVSAAAGTRVSAVSCSQSGQNLNCTATLSSALAAYAANGTATITINTTAPSSGTSVTNYVSVDPNGTNSPPSAAGCTSATCASVTTSLTGSGVISGRFLRSSGTAVSGATVNLLASDDTVITSATTNASGAYSFTGLRAGTYGVRFVSTGSTKGKAKSNSGTLNGEYIRNISVSAGGSVADADAVVIDPAGVIYNSTTRQAVAGAVVKFLYNGSLVNNAWLDQTLGGANSQTTAADGKYSFVLNSSAQSGTYSIDVTAPSGYTFQSTVISPTAGPYDPGLGGGIVSIQSQSTPPTGTNSTTYYLGFSFTVGTTAAQTSNGVTNNHIPVDPVRTITLANTTNAAEPSTSGTMTVSMSGVSGTDTVVSYSVAGTATSVTDYSSLSGTVTIPAGQTSATITIAPVNDSLVEGEETVIVTLTGVTSGVAQLSSTAASITATNRISDDDAPTVTIANTTNGAEPSTNGAMTVTLSAASGTNTVVSYSVGGTASAGTDYTALSGSVTITAGQTTATITIPVLDDSIVDGNETVIVTLTGVTSGTASLGTTTSATNTITDNDTATVRITNTTNGSEPSTNGVMTVTLSNASGTDTVVSYSVAGTATSGTDYTALSGSVIIAAGQTSATISIPVLDDNIVEGSETVIVTLTAVTSGSASLSATSSELTATNTIAEDDTATVSIANGGNAGEPSTRGSITVSLSSATTTATTVNYSVGGTATAGTDYAALSGSVTIAAGQTAAEIEIVPIDDTLVEGSETVIVTLTGVTGQATLSATPSALAATNTIADDDNANLPPAFTNTNATATNNAASYSFDYAENQASGATLGTVSATDTEGSALTFSITGGNANGWYEIDPATGVITLTAAGAASPANDFERAENSQVLAIQVSDGANGVTIEVKLNETDLDDTAPLITGPNGGAGAAASALSVNENQTSVTKITADESVTWSISGGSDADKFAIAADGTITFVTAPDYERPADSDTNNTYILIVMAADAAGNFSTQTITVTVLDLDDTAPLITGPSGGAGAATSAISVNENQVAVTRVTADEPVAWSISGGSEAAKFQIAADGSITFVAAPDYERPTDADTNNTYVLTITAGDAAGNTSTQTITVTVLDLDDTAPLIAGPSGGPGAATSAISVNENQVAVTRVSADEPVTWSISGGSEAAKFQIAADGSITFVAAPDYERPTDADTNNTYVLTITARDAAGNTSTQTMTVTVLDIDDTAPLITGPSGGPGAATSAIAINEGLNAVTTFTANERVTWSIDGGSDAGGFRIDPATGALVLVAAPDFENPTDSDRNNTYVVRIKAVDAAGNASYQTLTVTIVNIDEIGRKLSEIGGKLRTSLRGYAAQGLSDMLSFNETLMRAGNDDACTDPKAQKALSGAANANQSGGQVKLGFSQQLSECGRRNQVFADLGVTYAKRAGDWNSRMFASLRFERRLDADLMLGAALLASRGTDELDGFATSSISDQSLQLNLYTRYRLSQRLRTGAFLGFGRAWYDFGLRDTDGFVLDGTMTGSRQAYGWMLSGEFNLGETVITTDAIVSHAREKLGTATLAARYLGENRSGIGFAVGSVDTTRISIPVTAPIQLRGNEALGSSTRLLLSPGLLCEDNDVALSSLRCGYQLGAKLVANDGWRNRFYADYRWESVAGMRRALIGLGYAYRFGEKGIELALEANRGGAGIGGQDNRAMVVLRAAQ